jgi:hypothetical protein
LLALAKVRCGRLPALAEVAVRSFAGARGGCGAVVCLRLRRLRCGRLPALAEMRADGDAGSACLRLRARAAAVDGAAVIGADRDARDSCCLR